MKTCRICLQTKALSEFYKNHSKDGYFNECKVCQKAYARKYQSLEIVKNRQKKYQQQESARIYQQLYRQYYHQSGRYAIAKKRHRQTEKYKNTLKRYCTQHPELQKAWATVNIAVRAGKMPRPDTLQCSYSNHPATQYHHHKGYEKEHWLDVLPTCAKCHKKLHKRKKVI